jgi:hypothetical protein
MGYLVRRCSGVDCDTNLCATLSAATSTPALGRSTIERVNGMPRRQRYPSTGEIGGRVADEVRSIMNSSVGQQRCRVDKPHGEQASEMSYLPTVTDSPPEVIEDPVRQTQSAAPSDEVSSPELLITEQEVVFGTAAAVPLQRRKIGRRLVAVLSAMSADASRPRARYYPIRAYYLERALMAREMDRL